jgi:hypothetical protein
VYLSLSLLPLLPVEEAERRRFGANPGASTDGMLLRRS